VDQPVPYDLPSYDLPPYEPQPTYGQASIPAQREDVLGLYEIADALADTHEHAIHAVTAELRAEAIAAAEAAALAAEEERQVRVANKRVDLDELLEHLLEVGGSDLHLTAGSRPAVRLNGRMVLVQDEPVLTSEKLRNVIYAMLTERQRKVFEENLELDLAYTLPGKARFRMNIYQQRESLGAVLRVIPWEIRSLEELGMPAVLASFAELKRGLVLVTGPTGSGKSTTLAGILDLVNRNRHDHIMTIEDPIEFLHQHKNSIVNQREVGVDTHSFGRALRHVLRQDPDVILVGELRDLETIAVALTAAETGHLVLSTLHTMDATETVNRIISVFPPHQQKQIRLQLAAVLKAVVSLRLLPRADGLGRVPAAEVMISTAYIRDCIENKEKTKLIKDAIAQGTSQYGMQTFDQSLYMLYKNGLITLDEALRRASNPDEFRLKLQGIQSTSDISKEEMESKLSVASDNDPFSDDSPFDFSNTL
jgi:twitching motility protein PilT